GLDATHKRRRELCQFAIVKKQVDRLVAAQMAAFQQNRGMILLRQSFFSSLHLLVGVDRRPKQCGGFVEIRSNQRRERKQFLLIGFNSSRLEKIVATCRNHYRIDHKWDRPRCFFVGILNRPRDGRNNFCRAEQSCLNGADRKIFEQHFNFLANHRRRYRFNPRNFPRNFRHDACHSGQSLNAHRGKRLKVTWNPGPCAKTRTGARQGDRDCSGALRPPTALLSHWIRRSETAATNYAAFPSLPIASTGQPSIASLQRPSSSGVSGCLYTYEWPPSSFRLKFAGAVSRHKSQAMQ